MEKNIIFLKDLTFENLIATFAFEKRYLINIKRVVHEMDKKDLYSIYLTDKSTNKDCKLNEFIGFDFEDNIQFDSDGVNYMLIKLQTITIILKSKIAEVNEDEDEKQYNDEEYAKDVYFSKKDRIQLIAKMIPTTFKITSHALPSNNKKLLNLAENEDYVIDRDLPKVTVLKAIQLVNEILNLV